MISRLLIIPILLFLNLSCKSVSTTLVSKNTEITINGKLGHRFKSIKDLEQYPLTLFYNGKKIKTFLTNEKSSFSISFIPDEYGEYRILIPTNNNAWVGTISSFYIVAGFYEKKITITKDQSVYDIGFMKFKENSGQEFRKVLNTLPQSGSSH